jgi:hypothetical protein
MSIKLNINKIHGGLCELFGEVSVKERSSVEKGNYFELVAEKDGMKAVIVIAKKSVENERFQWGYYSNPESMDHLVERVSRIETISTDVEEIFEKKRFDSDYLSQIK